jgi:DNA-binding response OmpR family regulator
MRVLLVEDDVRFAEVLARALHRRGYLVDHVATAQAALVGPACDLVLLDLSLPDEDGLEVCRRLRAASNIPIIIITARGSEPDRVTGLRCGADDYLVKPFGVAELQARIEAVLRRAHPCIGGIRTVGRLRIDPARHQAAVDGRELRLARKEFQLLVALAQEPGSVVRRDQLVAQVWQSSWPGVFRTLEVHIGSLRAKVRAAVRIEAVRGVGYRMVPQPPTAPPPTAPPPAGPGEC